MNKRSFFLAMASLVVPAILSARVALPTHFTSNMVLQQQSSLLIKGQARRSPSLGREVGDDGCGQVDVVG